VVNLIIIGLPQSARFFVASLRCSLTILLSMARSLLACASNRIRPRKSHINFNLMDTQQNILTVPIAIIVAGIIIGGAVFLSRGSSPREILQAPTNQPVASLDENISLRSVDNNDHILGNPDAMIVMVEYSDLECPFCKTFHKTMQTIMSQYGKDGNVAWVYRHFPLDIHPKAPKEAEATECANELGGNEKFWAYVDKIFEITPSNNQLDPARLQEIAENVGLSKNRFETCLNGGKYAEKVKNDYNDGIKAGVSGTPNTVLVLANAVTPAVEKRLSEINQTILNQLPPGSPNAIAMDSGKRKIAIGGAFPLPLMKEIIDLLLTGK